MGFVEEIIVSFVVGGLLMDIGKMWVFEVLLQWIDVFLLEEMVQICVYVGYGFDIVRNFSLSDFDVIDILCMYYECYDGSGYLVVLWGGNILLVGCMFGIIDMYQVLISDCLYWFVMVCYNVFCQIYLVRDMYFQVELVEQFQVCLGVYFIGLMVELMIGEVVVVMVQNQV